MSKYAIFYNKKTDKKLIYYPCPKNANTSAKLFFAKHLNIDKNYLFLGDEIPQKNQKDSDYVGKKNIINFLPSKQPFQKKDADYKCCIIRDPIKRFISAFKNRILYHGDIQYNNYTIEMILDKLEIGLFNNKHFLPQSYFLGENLSYYTYWSTVEEIKIFEQKTNEFFEKKIIFPKIQIGGNKFTVKLSDRQRERIVKIYSKDYNFIS